jgi:hypothetical protein
MLAESLTRRRRVIQQEVVKIYPPPKIQTADALLLLTKKKKENNNNKKLRFDIPKIDSFIGEGLEVTDLCCISGYSANLLLTRMCIRSLLPDRYGGLGSPYVMIADAGNKTDVYGAVNFARQYGMSKNDIANRILVIRAFTVPQARQLLSVELPEIIQKYHVRSVIVPGLLNAFEEDPNMKIKHVKKETAKIIKAINELSTRVLVITSVQQMDSSSNSNSSIRQHSEPILRTFKKHIHLVQEKQRYGTLKAEIYNHGDSKFVNLTEKELKIVPKSNNP